MDKQTCLKGSAVAADEKPFEIVMEEMVMEEMVMEEMVMEEMVVEEMVMDDSYWQVRSWH